MSIFQRVTIIYFLSLVLLAVFSLGIWFSFSMKHCIILICYQFEIMFNFLSSYSSQNVGPSIAFQNAPVKDYGGLLSVQKSTDNRMLLNSLSPTKMLRVGMNSSQFQFATFLLFAG